VPSIGLPTWILGRSGYLVWDIPSSSRLSAAQARLGVPYRLGRNRCPVSGGFYGSWAPGSLGRRTGGGPRGGRKSAFFHAHAKIGPLSPFSSCVPPRAFHRVVRARGWQLQASAGGWAGGALSCPPPPRAPADHPRAERRPCDARCSGSVYVPILGPDFISCGPCSRR